MLRDDRDRWMRIKRTDRLVIGKNTFPNRLHPLGYPTVYDVDEFERDSINDTLKQILSGKAAYYGLGAEMEPTPDRENANVKNRHHERDQERALLAALEQAYQRMKQPL